MGRSVGRWAQGRGLGSGGGPRGPWPRPCFSSKCWNTPRGGRSPARVSPPHSARRRVLKPGYSGPSGAPGHAGGPRSLGRFFQSVGILPGAGGPPPACPLLIMPVGGVLKSGFQGPHGAPGGGGGGGPRRCCRGPAQESGPARGHPGAGSARERAGRPSGGPVGRFGSLLPPGKTAPSRARKVAAGRARALRKRAGEAHAEVAGPKGWLVRRASQGRETGPVVGQSGEKNQVLSSRQSRGPRRVLWPPGGAQLWAGPRGPCPGCWWWVKVVKSGKKRPKSELQAVQGAAARAVAAWWRSQAGRAAGPLPWVLVVGQSGEKWEKTAKIRAPGSPGGCSTICGRLVAL